MSLHCDTTFCGHRERATYWVGACECGWQGGEHPSSGSEGADAARRDYCVHVEEALGADAYIDVDVRCKNCGSEHRQGVLVGTHVMSAGCVRCGMRMLMPDNEAWRESTERARGFRW